VKPCADDAKYKEKIGGKPIKAQVKGQAWQAERKDRDLRRAKTTEQAGNGKHDAE
jgi:hypothetical protein